MPRKTKDDELKEVEKKVTQKATKTKSATVAKKSVSAEKTTATKKSVSAEKTTATKKSASAKETTATKKLASAKKTTTTTAKKATTSKTASKKSTTAKKTTIKKTTKTGSKKVATKKKKAPSLPILEYYDLPYRYNYTDVKVLAQNPHTLFVYWDIADSDRENLIKNYGDNFFNITKPVLLIHNLTNNYTYEIDINDFANNWYIHVDDPKCQYSVELGRRPKGYTQEVKHDYLNIAYSNAIEIPNDHILYFKENDKIYFKNIKTNKITEKTFKKKLYANSINEIYKNYNITENQDSMDISNPSSDFLTTNIL